MVCLKEENTKALQDASTALKAAMNGVSFPTGTGVVTANNGKNAEIARLRAELDKLKAPSPVQRRPANPLLAGILGGPRLKKVNIVSPPVVPAASLKQAKAPLDVRAKREAAWKEKGQAEWDAIKEAYLKELNAKTNTEWLAEEARRKAIINSNESHKDNYGFKPSLKNTRPKNTWISSWKKEQENEWKEEWLNKWQAAEVEKALQKEQKEVIRPIVDLELLLRSLEKEGNQVEIDKVKEELAKARAKAESNKREKLEQAKKEYLRKQEAVKAIQQRKEKASKQQNIERAGSDLLIGQAEEKVLGIKYELLKEELSEMPDRKKLRTLQKELLVANEELKKLRPPVKGGTRRNRRNRRRTRRN